MLSGDYIDKKSRSVIVKNINELKKEEYNCGSNEYYYRILLFEKSCEEKLYIDFKNFEIGSFTIFIVYPEQQFDFNNNKLNKGLFVQFTRDFLGICIFPSRLHFLLKYYFKSKVILNEIGFLKLLRCFEQIKECNESISNFKEDKLQKFLGLAFLELLEYNIKKNKISLKDNLCYRFLYLVMQHIDKYRFVKNYAKLLNVSIDKLEKEVRSQYEKLPSEIINELLLSEIKRLLLVGNYTHKEITFILNFDSPSSYSRFVKKHTGVTPTILRRKMESDS